MAKLYTVFVDDNFHYMDESERYKLGEFVDCASAVAACKRHRIHVSNPPAL